MNSRFIAIFKPEIINLKRKKNVYVKRMQQQTNRKPLLVVAVTALHYHYIADQYKDYQTVQNLISRRKKRSNDRTDNENALVSSKCNSTYSFGDWILRKGIWHGLHVHIHLCDVITQAHNNHTIKNHG